MFPLSTALLGFNCFVDEAWPATDVVVTRDLPYGSNFNNVIGSRWAPQRPTMELHLSVSPYAAMPTRVPGIDRCLYVIGGQVKRAEADDGLDHFPSVAMRVCDGRRTSEL